VSMLRSVAAVALGFAAMVIIVMTGLMAWMAARVPGGMAAMRDRMKAGEAMPVLPASYYVYNIALSLVAAVVAGWVTTRIAQRAPTGHLVALGVVVLAMGVVSAKGRGAERQPGWYKLVIPVVGLIGVALSALL
jgi:hypothetical protein